MDEVIRCTGTARDCRCSICRPNVIDEARTLLVAATPGPWRVISTPGEYEQRRVAVGQGGQQATLHLNMWPRMDADAALIAAAPRLVAGLLAEVERLTAHADAHTVDQLRKKIDDHGPEGYLVVSYPAMRGLLAEVTQGAPVSTYTYDLLDRARRAEQERDRARAAHSGTLAQLDEARSALTELVRLKDLRESLNGRGYLSDDYAQNRPKAWAEARRIVGSALTPMPAGGADVQIKHMVNRFLGWRLPDNFSPDAGISFKREFNEHSPWPGRHEPTGTNLFNADQAAAMVHYMVEGLPAGGEA